MINDLIYLCLGKLKIHKISLKFYDDLIDRSLEIIFS